MRIIATGSSVNILVTSALTQSVSYVFYAKTSANGFSSTCSTASLSYTVCPAGYVGVPDDSSLSVNQFCVMQFEAKNDGGGNAISTAGLTPWVNIDQITAKTECTSIGGNYDLISNPEWMTIARNLENVDSNWSGASVGIGCIFRGNSGLNDGCGYNGGAAESGTGRDTKAKHSLNNGEEIWDFAGNVWDNSDWNLGGVLDLAPTTCAGGWVQLPAVACGALVNDDYNSLNGGYTNTEGVGSLDGGGGGANLRGGAFDDGGVNGGIYTVTFFSSPATSQNNIGFRCVYRP